MEDPAHVVMPKHFRLVLLLLAFEDHLHAAARIGQDVQLLDLLSLDGGKCFGHDRVLRF